MSEGAKRKFGLNANAVKHAKPRPKAYKLSDRDELYLLVPPTGIRYWRMNYRVGGQQRALSFGRWPEILLGEPPIAERTEDFLEDRALVALAGRWFPVSRIVSPEAFGVVGQQGRIAVLHGAGLLARRQHGRPDRGCEGLASPSGRGPRRAVC